MMELYQKTYGQMEDFLKQGYYTHMTSGNSLLLILQSRKVLVMHQKMFRGAFVSTLQEYGFGSCGLVFRRNIERLSRLEHGFLNRKDRYWAGFSQAIPVTEFSLAYVILEEGNIDDCRRVSIDCKRAFGNEVIVTTRKVVDRAFSHIIALNMGIPEEWPRDEEDPNKQPVIQAVLGHFKALAQQAHVHSAALAVPCPTTQYRMALRQQQLAVAWG